MISLLYEGSKYFTQKTFHLLKFSAEDFANNSICWVKDLWEFIRILFCIFSTSFNNYKWLILKISWNQSRNLQKCNHQIAGKENRHPDELQQQAAYRPVGTFSKNYILGLNCPSDWSRLKISVGTDPPPKLHWKFGW